MTPSSGNSQPSAALSADDMASHRTAGHCRFDLAGATSAGLLPRALETIARLDIAPVECRASSGPEFMTISLTYHGLTAAQANTAANRMRNIHGMDSVTLVLSSIDAMTGAAQL